MKLMKKIPFKHESNQYEIRVLFENNTINTVVFHSNYPVNGYRYQIQIPKKTDPERIVNSVLFSETVSQAKQDITENRWEKLMQIKS